MKGEGGDQADRHADPCDLSGPERMRAEGLRQAEVGQREDGNGGEDVGGEFHVGCCGMGLW